MNTQRQNHRLALWTVLGVLLLATASCSLVQSTDKRFYRGHLVIGFETYAFRNCNADEVWWVIDSGASEIPVFEGYEQVALEPFEEVYLAMLAEISDRGQYGHLGAYDREVTVEDVLTMRKKEDDDCQ